MVDVRVQSDICIRAFLCSAIKINDRRTKFAQVHAISNYLLERLHYIRIVDFGIVKYCMNSRIIRTIRFENDEFIYEVSAVFDFAANLWARLFLGH